MKMSSHEKCSQSQPLVSHKQSSNPSVSCSECTAALKLRVLPRRCSDSFNPHGLHLRMFMTFAVAMQQNAEVGTYACMHVPAYDVCMYMRVYEYVCMHVCMHLCMHLYMYACMQGSYGDV